MNSSRLSPAFRISERRVPGSNSLWSGTDRVLKAAGFVKMM